jgi:hypothetical protein
MWHSPAKQRPFPHAGFCCPVRSSGNTAASDAHPAPRPLPGITGYRTGRSDDRSAASPGRGGPPQFPSPPSRRSTPHTPGGSSGLQSRIYTPSMAFAVNAAARLLLTPRKGGPLTTRQASLDAADRRFAPSNEASDAGLRPDPFPDRAASLLPGLSCFMADRLPPASPGCPHRS